MGGDLNTVVKCHFRNMDISINTFGESNSLRFVNLGINDLHKIFGVGNTNLANTLIIINGLTKTLKEKVFQPKSMILPYKQIC